MLYLAFDPGKTTGYTLANNVVSEGGVTFDLVSVGQIEWADRFSAIDALIGLDVRAIVVEDFKLFAKYANDQINSRFPSVLVIGIIQALAYSKGLSERLAMQDPALRHSTARIKQPEHAKILRGQRHALAAYQHLRYYLAVADKRGQLL